LNRNHIPPVGGSNVSCSSPAPGSRHFIVVIVIAIAITPLLKNILLFIYTIFTDLTLPIEITQAWDGTISLHIRHRAIKDNFLQEVHQRIPCDQTSKAKQKSLSPPNNQTSNGDLLSPNTRTQNGVLISPDSDSQLQFKRLRANTDPYCLYVQSLYVGVVILLLLLLLQMRLLPC
jgi:hypothetical protein